MASIYRVRTIWTGVAGTPYYSNFYFAAGIGTPGDAVTAVDALWTDLALFIDNGLTANVQGEVVTIDSVTGDVIAIDGGTTSVIPMGAAGDPAPPATQGLVRLNTGVVGGSRRIQGRCFIPGVTSTHVSNGRPSSAYVTAVQSEFATLVNDTAVDFVVWSKSTGLIPNVTSATVWSEFGVQRSRRD